MTIIPNPTKTIKINFSLSETRKAVKNIARLNSKFKKENFNDAIETYKFSTYEVLSLGAYIDISLSEIDKNKTEITITVSRKIGAFDKPVEVSLANDHIEKICEIISFAVNKSDEELEAIISKSVQENKNRNNKNKKNALIFYSIFIVIALIFFIYINYFHKKA